MDETVKTGVDTSTTEKMTEANVVTPETENTVVKESVDNPFKVFSTQEEFDKHSAGILNSARNKAEKEILSLLGLKPNEKDKLSKFKEAYDNTLSESEKQAEKLTSLSKEVDLLKAQIEEKDAIIKVLSELSGKKSLEISKYIKMAKGLVDDNTDITQALTQVLDYVKKSNVPQGSEIVTSSVKQVEDNPFKTDNLTKQAELKKSDREKAREMYKEVHGKYPSW